jgi:hypothetical protein
MYLFVYLFKFIHSLELEGFKFPLRTVTHIYPTFPDCNKIFFVKLITESLSLPRPGCEWSNLIFWPLSTNRSERPCLVHAIPVRKLNQRPRMFQCSELPLQVSYAIYLCLCLVTVVRLAGQKYRLWTRDSVYNTLRDPNRSTNIHKQLFFIL